MLKLEKEYVHCRNMVYNNECARLDLRTGCGAKISSHDKKEDMSMSKKTWTTVLVIVLIAAVAVGIYFATKQESTKPEATATPVVDVTDAPVAENATEEPTAETTDEPAEEATAEPSKAPN